MSDMTSSQLRSQQSGAEQQVVASGPQTIESLPNQVDLKIYRGDDFYLDLTVYDPDDTPSDLTGVTASSQIRASPGAAATLATLDAFVNGNVITLHLKHADSATLPNNCVWDAQMTYGSGDIITLAGGNITVSGEVTKP
jgi:hypothetical protein